VAAGEYLGISPESLCRAGDLDLQTRRDYLRNRSIIIIAVVEANLSEKNLLASPDSTLSLGHLLDVIPKLYLA